MASLTNLRWTQRTAESSRADCWGLLASSALHVAAIAAMSWWLLPGPAERLAPRLDTTWGPVDEVETTIVPVREMQPVMGQTSGGQASRRPVEIAALAAEPQFVLDQRILPAPGPLLKVSDLREPAPTLQAPGGQGGGSGTGVGDGSGGGRANSAGFFPTQAPQGRYVFVVDCSKSMNHRYHGPAKTRLGRVKLELWRSIYRMTPEQKFFIVFFNTAAFPMPAVGLVDGGPERKDKLLHWTTTIRGLGQTDPQDALLMAVRLQPDEIYFLTDGEFNYRVVREVTKANYGGIRIHTIALGDDSGGKFLEEIARSNNGTYRAILEEEDRYWVEEAASVETIPTASTAEPGDAAGVTPRGVPDEGFQRSEATNQGEGG